MAADKNTPRLTPPNQEIRGVAGNRLRSSSPTGRSHNPPTQPNSHYHGNNSANSYSSLGRQKNSMTTPNHKFSPHRMPQPDSVHETGKGAVPIRPYNNSGLPNISNVLRDNIK